MRRHLLSLTWFAVLGCAPGTITWETGSDVLRTAYYEIEVEDGAEHATLFLSNGRFPCDFELGSDPVANELAILEVTTAACREGARHLVLDLYKRPDVGWVGRFSGDVLAAPETLTEATPRLTRASYLGVEEVQVGRSEGLVPTLDTLELTDCPSIGRPGEVRLNTADDVLSGQFSFPDVHISGRFQAVTCEGGSALFDVLKIAPTASCPSDRPRENVASCPLPTQ